MGNLFAVGTTTNINHISIGSNNKLKSNHDEPSTSSSSKRPRAIQQGDEGAFFSSTWDEFDQMRNQMMEKNHGFWDKVDQDMKEFEKCVSQMEADMDSANAPLRPSLPSWAFPEDHKKNWPMIGNCTESKERSECEVVKLETTESKWEVELDVTKFKPEDLKVAVVGDLVTISGSQTEHFIGNDTSSNTLPSGCDPDTLSSSLTVSGNLKVTCPRKKWLTGPSAKAIRYN